jgi:hypothetical protein
MDKDRCAFLFLFIFIWKIFNRAILIIFINFCHHNFFLMALVFYINFCYNFLIFEFQLAGFKNTRET